MNRVSGFPHMGSVSIDEILKNSQTPVDLYLQLSNDRFVMVAKAGTVTSSLSRYKDRKVQYLYVRQTDFASLVSTSLSIAGVLIDSGSKPDVVMLNALEPGISALYSEFTNCGFDETTVAHSRLVAETTVMLCSSQSQLQKIVMGFLGMKKGQERHALMVSSLATMIGMGMGWQTPATLEKLALGGFLHDMGTLRLPPEIVGKREENMSKDEYIIYQSHADLGRDQSASVRSLPDDVTLMIFEHHERADGSGYPRGIKDLLTSPMGRVIGAANALTDLALKHAETMKPFTIEKAVKTMTETESHLYNREVLKGIKKLFENGSSKKAA